MVEGKYDKMRLSQVVDAVIITTDGFQLYKNKEKLSAIKELAQRRGVIILTDSDSAGFRIRNHIKQCLGGVGVKHAYIPAVPGKERRKDKPGAEGLLGVEGIGGAVILDALEKANAIRLENTPGITKADLFVLGFIGTPDSACKRQRLAAKIGLPPRISANALLDALNLWYTAEEFAALLDEFV